MAYWFYPKAAQNFVFLHGFTGTVEVWGEVASHLPKYFGAAALPLPGHAPQTPSQPTFEATCGALADAIRALTSPAVHLVGYSLGARLSLGIALRYPELLASVSLIGGHAGLETQDARNMRKAQDDVWIRMLCDQGIERFVAAWEAQPIFVSQHVLPQALRAVQRRHRLSHDAKALAASLASTGLGVMPNFWPKLKDNTVPMQLLVGEQDKKFVRLLEQMEKATPHAKMHKIAECGHNLVLEAPGQLAAWLCAAPAANP